MLTIGEFAEATGLTPKALRLYDDLGLLLPAKVDDRNGYRYYEPQQVEVARLVARLRLAGVPLARIAAVVTAASPEAAVAELLSYWRQAEAETASARSIITSLAAEMRGRDTTMSAQNVTARSAHRAGQGKRRKQLDDIYPKTHRLAAQITGQRLFVVADGFGDDDGVADAAIDALEVLDNVEPGEDPLGALDAAVAAAAEAVADRSSDNAGSTLTALVLLEDRALIAHVGDSRAFLVRDGQLERLTRDHTVVQSLVDEGRLTEAEARAEPNRALLNRALGHRASSAPDLLVRPVQPGDRFVLTTDGVHGVVDTQQLSALLVAKSDPDTVARAVEEAVETAGAPDNYGIVVVDL